MKLNQIIAVEKGAKTRANTETSELYKLVQKPGLFSGLAKTYEKLDEADADLPAERQRVQCTVPDTLKAIKKISTDYFDIVARKDWTNQNAYADVKVGEMVIIPQVPVTYLLFLEKQLIDLRTMAARLPVLDEAEDWTKDPSGNWKTSAVKTHRTKKVAKPIVLYPATEQHPAQTQMVTEDIIAGYWNTVKFSGAIPATERADMVEKLDALLRGVKEAREAANSMPEAIAPSVGSALFSYLGW